MPKKVRPRPAVLSSGSLNIPNSNDIYCTWDAQEGATLGAFIWVAIHGEF